MISTNNKTDAHTRTGTKVVVVVWDGCSTLGLVFGFWFLVFGFGVWRVVVECVHVNNNNNNNNNNNGDVALSESMGMGGVWDCGLVNIVMVVVIVVVVIVVV